MFDQLFPPPDQAPKNYEAFLEGFVLFISCHAQASHFRHSFFMCARNRLRFSPSWRAFSFAYEERRPVALRIRYGRCNLFIRVAHQEVRIAQVARYIEIEQSRFGDVFRVVFAIHVKDMGKGVG